MLGMRSYPQRNTKTDCDNTNNRAPFLIDLQSACRGATARDTWHDQWKVRQVASGLFAGNSGSPLSCPGAGLFITNAHTIRIP